MVAQVSLASGGRYYPRTRGVSARTGDRPSLHPLVAARLAAVPPGARVRGVGTARRAAGAGRRPRGRRRGPRGERPPPDHRRRPGWPGGPGDRRAPSGCATRAIRAPALPAIPARPARRSWARPRRREAVPIAGARMAARVRHAPAPGRTGGRRAGDSVITGVAAVAGVHRAERAVPGRGHGRSPALSGQELGHRVARPVGTHHPVRHRPDWPSADSADTLARVAVRFGAPLFPLGTAGPEGILAIAPDARVVLVDESGEWLLGTGAPPCAGHPDAGPVRGPPALTSDVPISTYGCRRP